ncbi:hypothetical protein STEG23_013887, partial [Scotinomys teguina]
MGKENVIHIHSEVKNNDIMKFAGNLMELENVILSEVTQTQKDKRRPSSPFRDEKESILADNCPEKVIRYAASYQIGTFECELLGKPEESLDQMDDGRRTSTQKIMARLATQRKAEIMSRLKGYCHLDEVAAYRMGKVTWVMDINTDPSCSRTMDPDMTLSSSLGLEITMAPVVTEATQISMALVTAQAHGHQYGFRIVLKENRRVFRYFLYE